jgi:omega-6 fatty acid desaturase (delta-12 desaturase)
LFRVLSPYRTSRNLRGAFLVVFDWSVLAVALFYAASASGAPARILSGLLAGLFITRLWVIGHDACHQSLFSTKRLNMFFGRLCFLPSLTPYTLWEVGHNVAHHGYNNLRTGDYIWAPMSPAEYLALPRWRQKLEQLYRSGFGVGAYYLIELWWKRLYVPSMPHSRPRRKGFTLDFCLVTVFAVLWISGAAYVGQASGVGSLAAVFSAVVLPFLTWNFWVGLVIHVHHIHEDIPWYDNKADWLEAQAVFTGTAHIDWPALNFLLHNILVHPAHHIDAKLNLFDLPAAQAELERQFPDVFRRRQLSWSEYFASVRACKVFDYEAGRWQPFPAA